MFDAFSPPSIEYLIDDVIRGSEGNILVTIRDGTDVLSMVESLKEEVFDENIVVVELFLDDFYRNVIFDIINSVSKKDVRFVIVAHDIPKESNFLCHCFLFMWKGRLSMIKHYYNKVDLDT